MKKLLTFGWVGIVCLLLLTTTAVAQVDTEDFENGYIVTAPGDTQWVKIKPFKEGKLGRSITIIKGNSDETEKVSPKDIIGFGIGDAHYASLPVDGKPVFMEREIKGELSLYAYTFRDDKKTITQHYVQLGDKPPVLITEKNFRKVMPTVIGEYKELRQRIENKSYGWAEKEAVVEAYNEWVKQGKPDRELNDTWTRDEGNFTRPPQESSQYKKWNRDDLGSRAGIEAFGMASFSFVNYDQALDVIGIRGNSNGFGFNTGVGARYYINKSVMLRGGIKSWTKRFQTTSPWDTVGGAGGNPDILIKESLTVYYVGAYLRANYESEKLFIGGGLDFSFFNTFTNTYRINDFSSGQLIEGGDAIQETFLAGELKNQVDMVINIGYKIKLPKQKMCLRPTFEYSIPLSSLFSYPTSFPAAIQGYTMSGFALHLGLIVDFGF